MRQHSLVCNNRSQTALAVAAEVLFWFCIFAGALFLNGDSVSRFGGVSNFTENTASSTGGDEKGMLETLRDLLHLHY